MTENRTPVTEELASFIAPHWTSSDPLIQRIQRDIHDRRLKTMQISSEQVMFHAWLCRLTGARRVLEIGTYLGLSAAGFARALQEGGHVDSIEVDPEYADIASHWLREGGLEDIVTIHRGLAHEIIPTLPGPYDLCFIDGVKRENVRMMKLCMPRTRRHGLILVDNVFYAGMVVSDPDNPDARGARGALEFARTSDRLDPVVLPIADGLLVCRLVS